ncbi:MAG: NAD(+) diphosphatase [Thermovirgaceae bacterium]|nr:NAD(+) diphosphatase [Thermovirgaceae bacterium]
MKTDLFEKQDWSGCFAFQGDRVLVKTGPEPAIPPAEDLSGLCFAGCSGEARSAGRPGNCWIDLGKEASPPEGMEFVSLRDIWGLLGERAFFEAGRAFQLMEWSRQNKFCGQCSALMRESSSETALVCQDCKMTSYPPVSPAIIVAIEKGASLLLARSPHFPKGRYSVLAGFVEPGETLEETVEREVIEEVSIRVKKIKYFGSQPWPFPHSLMVGFTAEWESGEIAVDGKEIEDAGWYEPDSFPDMPPGISISRRLIEDFLLRKGRR